MAGSIPANGAAQPTLRQPGWRRQDGQMGTASLRPHEPLQLHRPLKTNGLEEALPLLEAHTREVSLHSVGQELKNEEERQTDRKIHLALGNPQSKGHLEVIFHRAFSGPLANIILSSNLIVWDMGKDFPSILAGVGRGALSWVQDTWHLPPRLGSMMVWTLGQGGAQHTLEIALLL